MMMEKRQYKQGLFDKDTLTVKFGGEHSKPEFIFTAQAILVPVYKQSFYERTDEGGGWYGAKEWVEHEFANDYLITFNGVCIGIMYNPYVTHRIKTSLLPIDKKTRKAVVNFFNTLNIPYNYYIDNKSPLSSNLAIESTK
jgi:hypothetical protein